MCTPSRAHRAHRAHDRAKECAHRHALVGTWRAVKCSDREVWVRSGCGRAGLVVIGLVGGAEQ